MFTPEQERTVVAALALLMDAGGIAWEGDPCEHGEEDYGQPYAMAKIKIRLFANDDTSLDLVFDVRDDEGVTQPLPVRIPQDLAETFQKAFAVTESADTK